MSTRRCQSVRLLLSMSAWALLFCGAQTVEAAACNSAAGSGLSWAASGTWSCGHAPVSMGSKTGNGSARTLSAGADVQGASR